MQLSLKWAYRSKVAHESTLPFIKIKIFLILSHRRPEVVTDN